jgi:hypothetical protein
MYGSVLFYFHFEHWVCCGPREAYCRSTIYGDLPGPMFEFYEFTYCTGVHCKSAPTVSGPV